MSVTISKSFIITVTIECERDYDNNDEYDPAPILFEVSPKQALVRHGSKKIDFPSTASLKEACEKILEELRKAEVE